MSTMSFPFDQHGAHVEPTLDLANPQPAAFSAETGTGKWFAVGQVNEEPGAPLLAPETEVVASGPRRTIVRLVGSVAIVATLACLVQIITYAPARREILQWGSFGRSGSHAASTR
jgi:hypothetical protein